MRLDIDCGYGQYLLSVPPLKVLTYPNNILKNKSVDVEFSDEIKEFCNRLADTMYSSGGIGIAAPQVGRLARIFIADDAGTPRFFINPKVSITSNDVQMESEGCLSLPGVFAKVERPRRLSVTALNGEGVEFTCEPDGRMATVVSHETDHLDGVLFADRLSPLHRQMLLKKYDKRIRLA